ncbi:MAG: NAD/NADP octopine/nopaline dehydrogenase family protein [Acidobacteriota bacterium]|nr:NAD/NADP octopine/nopaline dehydrogenase family protein [Acidobacteriota bacterium]
MTIVGDGSSAHVLIPFLSGAGHRVQVLARHPDEWSEEIEVQLQSVDEHLLKTFTGRVDKVSSDPSALIPESDVVVLCMPVFTYRPLLATLAPYLSHDRDVYVGTIYGQAGFNWMVEEVAREHELTNVTTFAVGLIPWICRVREYGRIGVTYGCKEVNIAAVSPRDRFEELNEIFFGPICEQWLGTGAFRLSDSFLSLTLSVDNQIIHPARCLGLYRRYGGRWSRKEDIPYFYRDFDQLSTDIMHDLDTEYSLVRDGIRRRFPEHDFTYMLDYLNLERLAYQSENICIRESFTTSKTLGAIMPPTKQLESGEWVIDTEHRFFADDISYGVCIAKWMAEKMDLEVPTMDAIIEWAQEIRGETYIENGKLLTESESLAGRFRSGIPPVYGIETLEGIVD